jgi:hypothetical protein
MVRAPKSLFFSAVFVEPVPTRLGFLMAVGNHGYRLDASRTRSFLQLRLKFAARRRRRRRHRRHLKVEVCTGT